MRNRKTGVRPAIFAILVYPKAHFCRIAKIASLTPDEVSPDPRRGFSGVINLPLLGKALSRRPALLLIGFAAIVCGSDGHFQMMAITLTSGRYVTSSGLNYHFAL